LALYGKFGEYKMNKKISIALLSAGIIISVMGFNASDSFGSGLPRFFSNSPTDKAVWILLGGIVLGFIGALGLRGSKNN